MLEGRILLPPERNRMEESEERKMPSGRGILAWLLFNRLSRSKHKVGRWLVGYGWVPGTDCSDSCLEMTEAAEKGHRKDTEPWQQSSVIMKFCGPSLSFQHSSEWQRMKMRWLMDNWKHRKSRLVLIPHVTERNKRNWIPSILSCPLRLVCGLVSFHAFISVQWDRS